MQLQLQELTRRAYTYAAFAGWNNLAALFLNGQTPEMVFGAQGAERIRRELAFCANEIDRKNADWRVKWTQRVRAEQAPPAE